MKGINREKEKNIIKNSLGQSHEFIKKAVREGEKTEFAGNILHSGTK